MAEQQGINPDDVCRDAVQAKLNVYQAKEQFDSVLKAYNDQLNNLVHVVNLMKARILEFQGDAGGVAVEVGVGAGGAETGGAGMNRPGEDG